MITDKYEDIINLPHYEPIHPRMSMSNRAAQFAPFSALTGYDEEVKETSRITNSKIELSEEEISIINNKILELENDLSKEVIINYFVPDKYKKGGHYNQIKGCIKKIDIYNNVIVMDNKIKIEFKNILNIN
ncbi:MAG: hypothetical protein PUD59_04370 [bacterium]|nr:hypothetical protein [bacterium]